MLKYQLSFYFGKYVLTEMDTNRGEVKTLFGTDKLEELIRYIEPYKGKDMQLGYSVPVGIRKKIDQLIYGKDFIFKAIDPIKWH